MKKAAAVALSLVLLFAAVVSVVGLTPHGNGIKVRNWVTNDPDYTFSDQYKTSVWYHNFSQLELTENHRNNVLMIAISQLGYHEGEENDYSGTDTKSSGNCTEYARIYSPNYNNNCFDWCATFVNWCLNQARIDYTYGEMGCHRWIADFLVPQGMFQKSAGYGGKYTPKPADIIFFDWDENGNWADHIGFVLYVTDTTVYTVEGNTSDNVGLKSYPIADKRVMGYGTPAYEEKGIATFDYSPSVDFIAGEYIVTEQNAVLYEEADINSHSESIPFGAMVSCTDPSNGWIHIKYNGISGYTNSTAMFLLHPHNVEEITTETESETVTETESVTETQTETQTVTETVTDETTTSESTTEEIVITVETTLAATEAYISTDATEEKTVTVTEVQTTAQANEFLSGCGAAVSSAALIAIAVGAVMAVVKRNKQD